LRTCPFYTPTEEVEAQVYTSFRNFFTAEKLFLVLHQHKSDNPLVRAKLINFYTSWYDAQCREWEFLQSQGQAWARQLARVITQQKVPYTYYLIYYPLLPSHCQTPFLEGIQANEADPLRQKTILDHIQHIQTLQPQGLNKEEQAAFVKQEETYWQE